MKIPVEISNMLLEDDMKLEKVITEAFECVSHRGKGINEARRIIEGYFCRRNKSIKELRRKWR